VRSTCALDFDKGLFYLLNRPFLLLLLNDKIKKYFILYQALSLSLSLFPITQLEQQKSWVKNRTSGYALVIQLLLLITEN
jgi:hypothetical protein